MIFKTYILDKPNLVKYDHSMFAMYKSTPIVQLSTNSLSWHGQSEWTTGDNIDFLPFSNRICEYFLKTQANGVKSDPANHLFLTVFHLRKKSWNWKWPTPVALIVFFICFWTFTVCVVQYKSRIQNLGLPVLDMSLSKSQWKPHFDH